jgi:Tn3 transposase DDE domain
MPYNDCLAAQKKAPPRRIRTVSPSRSQQPVDDALLKHLSPLGWEHIKLTGDYVRHDHKRVLKAPIVGGKLRPPGHPWYGLWRCITLFRVSS